MNNSEVKSKIAKMFERENDFKFIYMDGSGECPDIFAVKFLGKPYTKGYKCQINITLNFHSMMWDVDVNGFNKLTSADSEAELEFAIRQQMKFARTPCAEQVLAESQVEKSDDLYY